MRSGSARQLSRRAMLSALASATGALVAVSGARAEEPGALQYKVVKSGEGPSVELGDLVGIRFKGAYNGVVFDNLFEAPTPYFYRAGSAGIILKVRAL